MGSKQNISITELTNAADTLDSLHGFEAARKRQEGCDLSTENVKPHFKPWRIFINHIDSYHGKILTDTLLDTIYIDPLSTQADVPPDDEEDEFEDDDDEYAEGNEREKRKPGKSREVSRKYEVIGTVLDRKYSGPEDVTVINSDDKDLLLSELMICSVIIYDITQQPDQIKEACWILKEIVRMLEDMERKSSKTFKRDEPTRYFILISTIMTWAFTKPLDPADPDLPFTEADYRKRKPHPNYKEHIQCEREVVAVKKIASLKSKLNTLVICCGITYGEEEGPIHYLFKMAWQNAPFLPIFGKGRNKIPLLYVRDLAATVSSVLQNWPPMRYIVAVEQELISQSAIVKKISQGLTTGEVKSVSKEVALSLPEVSQQIYDQMTVDLNIDPVYIIDRIRWHFGMPFRDVVNLVIKEYKVVRNLRPVKIVVLGPPASGKTRVARYLAEHYGIHYVHVKTLISDAIQKLINGIEAAEASTRRQDDPTDIAESVAGGDENKGAQKEEVEDKKEVVLSPAKLQEQLDEIRSNMAANNGRLDDIILNRLFLNRLNSKDCLNQGYVMDGHPKTFEQARNLFLISDESLEEVGGEDENVAARNVNTAIVPELVVVLEASDEFLKERIINRPEREIQNTHYTEEHMLRRMREYRERNTDDNTPLQLFDEMEIHPLVIFVETDTCPDMFPTVYRCLEKLGEPRNYGPTAEEMEVARKRAEAEKRAAEVAEELRKEREILECKRRREEKMMEWTNLMEKLKQEEEERLCILAEPLRHYLMKYVFPTLTEALIEVANLRPEDPIDFLAEYLFKKNPEGRMFEPDYTETMSMLLDVISRQQNDVLPREGLEADVAQFLTRRQDELSTAADKIERDEAQDAGGEADATSILERSFESERIDDSEKEELDSFSAEWTTNEFGSEA
ncbi:PREDICTED: adenylate kinase 7-like [Wasmannia auropunctata]|uniref:adenylate kinase 7-like n=1 Tax=Wasmannia auropunctata TaxID=64793 RepID=UPI0005EE2AC4|nr:PREDICTED: adenylate kinase 7-like [Wasmannia auropunctata]XP_011694076.1 PREDICTED: adenylate kinase 7-like [Wasmannia auropunctata]